MWPCSLYNVSLVFPERSGEGGEREEGERAAGCGSGPLHQRSPENQRTGAVVEVHGGQEEREGEGCPVSHTLEVRELSLFENVLLPDSVCRRERGGSIVFHE